MKRENYKIFIATLVLVKITIRIYVIISGFKNRCAIHSLVTKFSISAVPEITEQNEYTITGLGSTNEYTGNFGIQ